MTKSILLWILGGASVLGFIGWRLSVPHPAPARVAVLWDSSRSLPQDCGALVSLGQRALSLPDVRPGSTLALFVSGDSSTGYEPSLVASYELPVGRRATESKRRLIERQKKFLAGLERRCADFPQTQVSPIFRSLNRLVSHLRALNQNKPGVLYLLARTDLRENSDAAVRRALRQPVAKPVKTLQQIDNTGINIAVCGLAETVMSKKDRAPYSADRVVKVWQALFTQPDLARLEPFCPKPETVAEAK